MSRRTVSAVERFETVNSKHPQLPRVCKCTDQEKAFKQAIKLARRDCAAQDQLPCEPFKVKLRHLKQAIENCKEKTRYILAANQVSSEAELAEKRMERQRGLDALDYSDGGDPGVGP